MTEVFYTLELNVSIQIDYSCLTDELITWQKTAENWRCCCCFTNLWLSIHDEIRESNTFWQSCKKVSKHRFYKKPFIIHASWETVHSQWHGLTPVCSIPIRHFKCDSSSPQLDDFADEKKPEFTSFHMLL